MFSYWLRAASKKPLGRVVFGLVSPFTSSEPEVSVVLQDVTLFQKRFDWVNVHMSGSGRRDPSPSSKLVDCKTTLKKFDSGL